MIPSDELAALRSEQAAALPDTAVILRVTRTSDGAGGFSESEATAATVACRLTMGGSRSEQVFAERQSLAETATVTLPHGTDVRLADRLSINGATWRVEEINERSWSTALRIIVTRVR
jgi:hypothetical protein